MTAKWQVPSSYPKLTLGKKGIYLVEITWSQYDDGIYFPLYYQLQIHGGAVYGQETVTYVEAESASQTKVLNSMGITKSTVDNDTVWGYMHTETANISFFESITAVYLGAVET